ncbi:MAG: UDP-N-acetylglucosamine 2-epimerase [Syntrophomonadaceae bacterium]|nr:UDP-N-acetylglucosamine 2-epimerase [Syntrophomonadaceae bacterium]
MNKIVFITGTRADYGKLKPLINGCIRELPNIETNIYVSGMHLLDEYGGTYKEIIADGYDNIHLQRELPSSLYMDENLAITMSEFSQYVRNINPNMIIVHGDRIEALAAATVAMLNNICLGHIEGGEVTGTVDESIRHAISKMANLHFVANQESKLRLIQLGEEEEDIFVIGSPDIDIMLSDLLPDIGKIKNKLGINFANYGILIYHPVTSELDGLSESIQAIMKALIKSQKNYIAIYPNNDSGSQIIINEYKKHFKHHNFMFFKSINFEPFLTLLKNCEFIIGNSSAGIREACVYGIPAIDIGTRQKNRYSSIVLPNIIKTVANQQAISESISVVNKCRIQSSYFGDGKSTNRFISLLKNKDIWRTYIQKNFNDTLDTKKAIALYHNEVCF